MIFEMELFIYYRSNFVAVATSMSCDIFPTRDFAVLFDKEMCCIFVALRIFVVYSLNVQWIRRYGRMGRYIYKNFQ